jgi:hypothetical protein
MASLCGFLVEVIDFSITASIVAIVMSAIGITITVITVPFCAFEFGAAFLHRYPRDSTLIGSCELHIEDGTDFLVVVRS